MSHLLAIDVGTLSARAGLFDLEGRLLAAASASFELLTPAEHHAVYRMDDIWQAVCHASTECLAQHPELAPSVAGLAFDATSSLYIEAEGGAPLDGGGDVMCWMDHRGEAEAAEIDATGHRFLDHVGGSLSPETNLPKLLWLKRHRPAVWARVTGARDLCDELARCTTDTDRHSVCGLGCKWPYLPNEAEPWCQDLLEKIGIGDLTALGHLKEKPGRVGEMHGRVTASAGAALGIPAGIPVAIGLIDAEAGALGVLGRGFPARMNNLLPMIGGSSTCYMPFARDARHVSGVWGPFKDAVFPGYWMHEAGQSLSGTALDAVLNHHPASPGRASSALHLQTAERILKLLDAEGAAFAATRHIVPDWLGNRAPLGDGRVRALATGIGPETGERAFLEAYYATARALALQTRQILEHLNVNGHYAFDSVALAGGHLHNPLLVRLYRDVIGARLIVSDAKEPVLLGTAMVAAVAAGFHADLFASLEAMAPGQTVLDADPYWQRAHDAAYRIYLTLFKTRNEIEIAGRALEALSPAEPSGAI
ncbi:ribulokinase [Phyllobacterium phragmitis]|uniref:Ribulokinase n=1 Tax=Phyllobacterium phragmitis TaxID=2670329 RepID=A0A2S9IPQ2_9HYPH|nr:FGGY-family carbohydrate kinase [Phyllobacterium phragmitis]PRD42508.1 ribulokinase [Phyllobacterium phragmitis]